MKPRRLVMVAFGPYAGEQVLDFDRLPPGALFLVTGPTGSGKTSMLDAMCFALYGESSGEERDGSSLRSHHAPDDLETEVRFDFDLGTRRYRVERAPKQARAKLRGEGSTTVQPRAELVRLDADGAPREVLASGDSKVSAAVTELLQLAGAQFRQVVVLPQGRFRDLLTASSKEREAILEQLFQTRHYKAIEEALKARAGALRERVKASVQRETVLTDTLARQVELPEDAARTVAALRESWTALDARVAAAKGAAATAQAQAARADKAFEEADVLAQRFVERDAAHKAKAALDDQADAIAAKQTALDAARRAAPLAARLESAAAARRAAADAARARDALVATCKQAEVDAAAAAETYAATQTEEARDALETARAEVTRLEGLADDVEAWRAAAHATADTTAAVTTAETAHERAAGDVPRAETALEAAEQAQRDDALAAAKADGAGAAAVRLARVARLREDARRTAATLARSAQEHETRTKAEAAAAEAARATLRALDDARALRERGSAARLAAALQPGRPCPVCGATEHPQPAAGDHAGPDDARLEALETAAREAAEALETARRLAVESATGLASRRTEAATAAETLQAEDDAALDDEALAARAAEARARHEQAHAAAARADARARAVAGARERLAAARAEAESARAAWQVAREEQATARARVEALAAKIPEALRADGALPRALDEATTTRDALATAEATARTRRDEAREAAARLATEAEGAAREAATREGEAATAAAELASALADAGFEDAAAAQAALRDEASVAALERAVRDHAEALRSATDRLERAAEAVADLEPPDLESLRSRREEAAATSRERARSAAVLEERSRESAKGLEALEREAGARAEDEAALRLTGGLADVATGDNPSRLSFHRYVLAALLDEVLEVATARLLAMSQGRFRLQRRRGTADRRKVSGLDLEVHDEWTGEPRPAATLSGGEGFLAALALALATADVVRRHAGGIHLDALFVDEGFGSLDPNALEEAVGTLLALGEGGRMVGVISHVGGLREFLPCRLEVEGGPRGSQARFVVP